MSEDNNLENHPRTTPLDHNSPDSTFLATKNESPLKTVEINCPENRELSDKPIALDESSRSNIKLESGVAYKSDPIVEPQKILSELLKTDVMRNNSGNRNAILNQIKEIDTNNCDTALSFVSSIQRTSENAISAESSSGCIRPKKQESGIRCLKPESASVNPTPDSKYKYFNQK